MAANVYVKSVDSSGFTQEIRTENHSFYGDEPTSVGGTAKGPTPYEFLLAALGT